MPGDRAETCKGILKPIGIEVKQGEMQSIQFECVKCKKRSRNKIAEDDDRDALFKVFGKIVEL